MSNLKCIAEHTVDLDLLTGGIVIDAGCLGFEFSEAMAALGCTVYAYDIQPLKNPAVPRVNYTRSGISNYEGESLYVETTDAQGHHLSPLGMVRVPVIDIFSFINTLESEVECLKLDIEGEEFKILTDTRLTDVTYANCPRQISFELHQHTNAKLNDQQLQMVWNNLSYNYKIVHSDYSRKHGCPENYWDVLAIRKDLI